MMVLAKYMRNVTYERYSSTVEKYVVVSEVCGAIGSDGLSLFDDTGSSEM